MEQGKLTISGLDDVVQVINQVQYSRKKEWYYILYQENLEGFEDYSSRLKCRDGYLEILRKGNKEVRMVYEQGKEYCMLYPTPYGAVDLKISTSKVTVEEDSQKVTVLVECCIGDDSPKNFTIQLEK